MNQSQVVVNPTFGLDDAATKSQVELVLDVAQDSTRSRDPTSHVTKSPEQAGRSTLRRILVPLAVTATLVGAAVAAVVVATSSSSSSTEGAGIITKAEAKPNLIWQDEFSGNTLDTSKWSHNVGDGCNFGLCGWGNGELQWYQEASTQVSGGTLKIKVERTEQGPRPTSSSRIHTRNKFAFKYGRVVKRMRMP
jgi:hypothetical protein